MLRRRKYGRGVRALALVLAVLTIGMLLPHGLRLPDLTENWYHDSQEILQQNILSDRKLEILQLANGPFSGGNGTSADPYLVATLADLKNVASYSNQHFRQVSDISLGTNRLTWGVYNFTGTYDGGGFSIIGGNRIFENDVLFQNNQGTIKNLHIKDAHMTCTQSSYTGYPALLVQKNSGIVENCSVSGSVTVDGSSSSLWMYAAGLAAVNYGTIKNCKNYASVTLVAPDGTRTFLGGITGNNAGTIKNCLNAGEVHLTESWQAYVGGIAGYSQGTVTSTKNTGSIYGCTNYYNDRSAENQVYVGGIVGHNKGLVSYGENTGAVEAEGKDLGRHANAGGITGYTGAGYTDVGPYVVEYSKNSGPVLGHSNNGEGRSGGITGTCYKNSYVRYCCNTGKVSATNSGTYSLTLGGGIAGAVQYGTMMQCCNHGDVYLTSQKSTVIGCGLADASDGVFTDCYNVGKVYSDYRPVSSGDYGILAALFYDNGTSCQNCYNLGEITSTYSNNRIYGLYADRGGYDHNTINNCYTTQSSRVNTSGAVITAEQAKQKSTFAGYDFTRIWGIDPNVNNGHPYLRAIPAANDLNWYADSDAVISVSGVQLNQTSLTLDVGGTAQLRATVLPANAKIQNVTWASSKTDIATVDENGLVQAHNPGTAVVTVRTEDGGFTATCIVRIAQKNPAFSGGSGTEADPYLVANAQDLMDVVYRKDAHYRQVADISLAGVNFLPIGVGSAPFTGVYDGNKCLITGLRLETAERVYLGIFGASSGTITNVLMADCIITARSSTGKIYCGTVVGHNTGTVRGCTVVANLSASTDWEEQDIYIGGVCGYSAAVLKNCTFRGTVHGAVAYVDSTVYAGGISGFGGSAEACCNYGKVSATGALDCDVYTGGILAYANGAMSGCFNAGSIHSSESRYAFAGGIAGLNVGNITGCRNEGAIYSATAYAGSSDGDPTPPEGGLAVLLGGPEALAGGITASNFATVSYCENIALIHAESTSSSAYAGGVVGYNNGQAILERSKNSGEIRANSTAGESRAGGIASSSHANSFVRYCCNTGDIYITNNGMYNTGCAGGVLAVLQYGTAQECCSHGDVYVSSEIYEPHGAAIVGSCTDAVLQDCYSDGDVSCDYSGGRYPGVICGITGGNGNAISRCYFTGELKGSGEHWRLVKIWGGDPNTLVDCYASMTATQATEKSTYEGFDFTNVWAIDPARNNGRPYLRKVDAVTSGWYIPPAAGDQITLQGYSVQEGYLLGLSAGTTAATLFDCIAQMDVRVQSGGRILAPNAALGTGMTLQLVFAGSVVQEVTLVVRGDTNGDGSISVTDFTNVKAHLLQLFELSTVAAKAGDVNGDGTVTLTDFLQVKAHLLGISLLNG